MGEKKEKRKEEDVEDLREVLSVVSKEVPALIRGIIAGVFSEDRHSMQLTHLFDV